MIISQYPLKLEDENLQCLTCIKDTETVFLLFLPRSL